MLTRTLIAATSIAAVAAVAPAAIAIDQAINGAPTAVAPGSTNNPWQAGNDVPGNGSASNGNSGNSSNGNSGNSGSTGSTATPDTGSTEVTAQTQGVVMIDTVLPGGEGAGTGMILTSDGTVLTNYHVVNGSTQIRVIVPGGKTYTATVVGHDQSHDVAVLKLKDASNLKTVKLDSDGVKTGQSVTAVGQGGGQSVLYTAKGSITGLNESITASDSSSLSSSERLTGLIQTNAAIVPGYSGGPLFDSQGEVIGINTAAASSNSQSQTGTGTANAQGYAIPINNAMGIANSILKGTKTATNHIGPRAALGIQVLPSGSSSGQNPWGQAGQGVIVQGVVAGDAAADAGIAKGDTINAIAGTSIDNTSTLADVMNKYYPGDKVSVTWTDTSGQSHSSTLTLETSSAN